MSEREPLIKAAGTSYNTYDDRSSTSSTLIINTLFQQESLVYTWSDINVYVPEKSNSGFRWSRNISTSSRKHILKDVTGAAYPGELLAILGSSGAGKTTLLNALTFRSSLNAIVNGIRCINSNPVDIKTFASQSAYVQQNDLFIGSLTVKEHLIFQALVRMDRGIPHLKRMARVEEVLNELSLKKCESTRIGVPGRIKGISGGEMKRLSFAAEVLTNPSLMFCDEPTSGLDSFMALNVIQVLKNIAQTGKTVVCTIHQPSSELYAMFDKILLLAEGRVAFLGTPDEAELFYTGLEAPCPHNYNPADYYIQLLAIIPGREESCKQAVNMICNNFARSELGRKYVIQATTVNACNEFPKNGGVVSNYKASWLTQFRAVFWRSWSSVIREPMLIKVRLLQTLIIGLIMGFIYYGQQLTQDGVMNINGALFIFLTCMTFQNVFSVVAVFCSELPIFLRENRNGMYRTDVYFICKTLSEAPLFTFIPILFVTVSYFLIGLEPRETKFFITVGIMILIANVATSFGYLISCISSSVNMALSIGPPIIIPFLLFGGFFLNAGSTPIYFKWLSYLSWFRYGNEALLINQWKDINSINCTIGDSTCPKNGHVILETYNFSENNFQLDLIALCALICGFRLLAYIALLIKTYRYQ